MPLSNTGGFGEFGESIVWHVKLQKC